MDEQINQLTSHSKPVKKKRALKKQPVEVSESDTSETESETESESESKSESEEEEFIPKRTKKRSSRPKPKSRREPRVRERPLSEEQNAYEHRMDSVFRSLFPNFSWCKISP
jgi:hypothetical protein